MQFSCVAGLCLGGAARGAKAAAPPATTEIYTLSLHDALPIFPPDSVNKAKGFEIELDVVECADFAREMGKWRKMMPPGTLVKAGFDPDYEPP